MNQSNVTFTDLDPNQEYEATVGTVTISTGMEGPSETTTILVLTSQGEFSITTIIIAVSMVAVVLLQWLLSPSVASGDPKCWKSKMEMGEFH